MTDEHTRQTIEQVTNLINQALTLADQLGLSMTAIYLEQALSAIITDIPPI